MPETNNRNVAKKPISKSFRGILRVSPAEDNADTGLTELAVPISDSAGNNSPVSMGLNHIEVKKEIVSETQLKDRITIGEQADLPTASPGLNEIFVGDNSGNYKLKNIIDIIKQYLNDNNTYEQMVPVGTIMPIALAQEDLNLLPERFREWYDFCHGQDRHSLSGKEYNSTNYPELYRAIVGNPRLDYDTISLQIPQIAASLFNQNNITQLSGITINGIEGTGQKNCVQVCDRLLVQDVNFDTDDFFTDPTVEIKWNQEAENINVELNGEYKYTEFLKYIYLPEGTEITIQGCRFRNEISNEEYSYDAYIFNSEIRKDYVLAPNNVVEKTIDKKIFIVQEPGIYGILLIGNVNNSTSHTSIQNAKVVVTIPEIEVVLSVVLLSSNELYFPINYAEYSTYNFGSKLDIYNVSTTLANNEGNIVLDNYEKFAFCTEPTTKVGGFGGKPKYYLISKNINKDVIDTSNNEYGLLPRKLNNTVSSFSLDINYENYKEHPFGTAWFVLYLKKGTIVSAQGLSYFDKTNNSEQAYLYINDMLSTTDQPVKIGAAINWTVPKDGIYSFETPFYVIGVGQGDGYDRIGIWKPYVRINQGSVQWQIEGDGVLSGTRYDAIGVNGGETSGSSLKFRLPDTRNRFIRGASPTETTVPVSAEGGYVIPAHEPFTVEYPQTNLFDVTKPVSDLLEDHRHYMVARWSSGDGWYDNKRIIAYGRGTSEMPGYSLSPINWIDPYDIDISNMLGLSGPATTKSGGKVNFPPRETRPNNISFSYLIKIK